MAGEFQADSIKLITVPCDAAFETTPTATEIPLLAVPDNANFQVELLSVGFFCVTLPVDGSNTVTADLEWVDDSDTDAVADLKAGYNFLAAGPNTARVNNEIWRGSQILDPGDTANMEMHVTTPDTASEGAAFVVEYRVLKHS